MGITTQQLNEILARKAMRARNPELIDGDSWTAAEKQTLITQYPQIGRKAAAALLGKSEHSIRSMASRLGLKQDPTSPFFKEWQDRAAQSKIGKKLSPEHVEKAVTNRSENWKNRTPGQRARDSEIAKERVNKAYAEGKLKGNPQVFRDMWANPEQRAKKIAIIKLTARKMWDNPNHVVNSNEFRQRKSDQMTKWKAAQPATNCFSRTKKGERPDMPGLHFRSSWEANYARYLNWLLSNGQITLWRYEPKTFWFETIKRGCRSWKPDFLVVQTDGREEYHEVKGWMYPRSKTALKRMKKYHPEILVVLIDQYRYKALAKQLKFLIPNWE